MSETIHIDLDCALDIYRDDDCQHWTLTGDLRDRYEEHQEANYDAQDAFTKLFPDVQFDSEFSQFFAYCDTRIPLRRLAYAIKAWRVERMRVTHGN